MSVHMGKTADPSDRSSQGASWASFHLLWADDPAQTASPPGRRLRMIAAVLCLLALLVVVVAWNGAAKYPFVALQVPYLISGAVTALLVTIVACTLLLASYLVDATAARVAAPPQTAEALDPARFQPVEEPGPRRRARRPASG